MTPTKEAFGPAFPGETWRTVPNGSHGLCRVCLPLERARFEAELAEAKGQAA